MIFMVPRFNHFCDDAVYYEQPFAINSPLWKLYDARLVFSAPRLAFKLYTSVLGKAQSSMACFSGIRSSPTSKRSSHFA